MDWRENYYTCKEYKIEIALQWNPDFSNNLTWQSKFVRIIGTFKDRDKITVFGWRREVKFPSKYREFQNSESSRNWGSTVLYRSLWTTIKRDGLKNLVSLRKKLHVRVTEFLVVSLSRAHGWPMNCSVQS